MGLIDRHYTAHPFYGWRRMTVVLRRDGHEVNHKRVRRLMRQMGIQAIYPRPRTSQAHPEHRIYPYLLRNLTIERVNQVWSTDITYIPIQQGFMYLVAVMDWHSRYVLAWQLSNTLDGTFCLDTLNQALGQGKPEIFNTDQGSQFTAHRFIATLEQAGVRISMDGRGRAFDNIFIERLWRTVKYEDVYLKQYEAVPQLYDGLRSYFQFYNHERPHQSLGNATPAQIYFAHKERRLSG